jgi:hypothetical protein
MTKAKPKSRSPFWGRWRIISMTAWDKDYFDKEVQAYLQFSANDTGEFHVGCVRAIMDCRETTRGGLPMIEWAWEGNDEMDLVQGRGWAVLNGDELRGTIFFHGSDESGFVAKRSKG